MNDRIQRVLDEEWGCDALTPSEATELDESSALVTSVLHAIPARPLPDLGPTVLRRIAAAERASTAPKPVGIAQ